MYITNFKLIYKSIRLSITQGLLRKTPLVIGLLLLLLGIFLYSCSQKKKTNSTDYYVYSIDSIGVDISVPNSLSIYKDSLYDRLIIFNRKCYSKDSLFNGFIVVEDYAVWKNGFKNIHKYLDGRTQYLDEYSSRSTKLMDSIYYKNGYKITYNDFYIEEGNAKFFKGYIVIFNEYRMTTIEFKSIINDSSENNKNYLRKIYSSVKMKNNHQLLQPFHHPIKRL